MKKNAMLDYLTEEQWAEKVIETINTFEKIRGIKVSDDAKETVYEFMRRKIRNGIKKGKLTRTFMQIAVTSLLYLKLKGKK